MRSYYGGRPKTRNATPGNGQPQPVTMTSRPHMPVRKEKARLVKRPHRFTSLAASVTQRV